MSADLTRQQLTTALESRYSIERKIGAGGMATVYLARDLRHNRNVALKVLDPELGAVLGGERFLSEIEVTANLQHPNLLPLFDSGEAAGLLFYVMPFVEGETLRARLEREKQLPVDEALRIAKAVAGALDYAHRHGVVHRDLKPENILMLEGQPLIADFGIALAVSKAGGARITQTGLSLGTPQYMSPEQATADRVVDGRTDIFSLGAITYEMLAGDPPHVASTSQAIIAKLLTEKPTSLRVHRPNVPPHVDAAVATALEKLPADRFATAREFAEALDGKGVTASVTTPVMSVPRRGTGAWRERAAWMVAALLALALGWSVLRPVHVDAPQVVRVNFDLPPGTHINDVITGTTVAVSPRGDMLAFTSTGANGYHMYVRRINELAARELTSTAGRNLAFSPDGKFLAFTEGNVIKKVAVAGGEVQTIAATTRGGAVPYGLAWSERDTLYIGSFTGLFAVPAQGGQTIKLDTPRSGTAASGASGLRWPLLLPGGQSVAFASGNSSTYTASRLGVFTLSTGRMEQFDIPVAMPLGLVDGYLVYVSTTGALSAIPFDMGHLRPSGDPIQLDENVLVDPTAGAKATLSASGTLAYLRGRALYQPMLVRSSGDSMRPILPEPGSYQSPRYSPDGRRIAMAVFGANATDIWVYDVVRHTFTRLTTEGLNLRPEWTADGKNVLFISTRDGKPGIWQQPADGSGPATLLYTPEVEPFEALMSPDMQWLVFRTAPGDKYPRDILAVHLADKKVLPLVVSPFSETQPRLSPNGKWLAYQSSETGRFEIYVRPFPEDGARVQVSDNSGTEPLWSRDGKAIYYRGSLGEVIKVDITTSAGFAIGQRTTVLSGDFLADATHPNYDVAPDGRFLMLKRAGPEAQTIVVHNWSTELREKLRSVRR